MSTEKTEMVIPASAAMQQLRQGTLSRTLRMTNRASVAFLVPLMALNAFYSGSGAPGVSFVRGWIHGHNQPQYPFHGQHLPCRRDDDLVDTTTTSLYNAADFVSLTTAPTCSDIAAELTWTSPLHYDAAVNNTKAATYVIYILLNADIDTRQSVVDAMGEIGRADDVETGASTDDSEVTYDGVTAGSSSDTNPAPTSTSFARRKSQRQRKTSHSEDFTMMRASMILLWRLSWQHNGYHYRTTPKLTFQEIRIDRLKNTGRILTWARLWTEACHGRRRRLRIGIMNPYGGEGPPKEAAAAASSATPPTTELGNGDNSFAELEMPTFTFAQLEVKLQQANEWAEEVNRHFKALALKYHPDKVPGTPESKAQSALKFRRINTARELLLRPQTARQQGRRFLETGIPPKSKSAPPSSASSKYVPPRSTGWQYFPLPGQRQPGDSGRPLSPRTGAREERRAEARRADLLRAAARRTIERRAEARAAGTRAEARAAARRAEPKRKEDPIMQSEPAPEPVPTPWLPPPPWRPSTVDWDTEAAFDAAFESFTREEKEQERSCHATAGSSGDARAPTADQTAGSSRDARTPTSASTAMPTNTGRSTPTAAEIAERHAKREQDAAAAAASDAKRQRVSDEDKAAEEEELRQSAAERREVIATAKRKRDAAASAASEAKRQRVEQVARLAEEKRKRASRAAELKQEAEDESRRLDVAAKAADEARVERNAAHKKESVEETDRRRSAKEEREAPAETRKAKERALTQAEQDRTSHGTRETARPEMPRETQGEAESRPKEVREQAEGLPASTDESNIHWLRAELAEIKQHIDMVKRRKEETADQGRREEDTRRQSSTRTEWPSSSSSSKRTCYTEWHTNRAWTESDWWSTDHPNRYQADWQRSKNWTAEPDTAQEVAEAAAADAAKEEEAAVAAAKEEAAAADAAKSEEAAVAAAAAAEKAEKERAIAEQSRREAKARREEFKKARQKIYDIHEAMRTSIERHNEIQEERMSEYRKSLEAAVESFEVVKSQMSQNEADKAEKEAKIATGQSAPEIPRANTEGTAPAAKVKHDPKAAAYRERVKATLKTKEPPSVPQKPTHTPPAVRNTNIANKSAWIEQQQKDAKRKRATAKEPNDDTGTSRAGIPTPPVNTANADKTLTEEEEHDMRQNFEEVLLNADVEDEAFRTQVLSTVEEYAEIPELAYAALSGTDRKRIEARLSREVKLVEDSQLTEAKRREQLRRIVVTSVARRLRQTLATTPTRKGRPIARISMCQASHGWLKATYVAAQRIIHEQEEAKAEEEEKIKEIYEKYRKRAEDKATAARKAPDPAINSPITGPDPEALSPITDPEKTGNAEQSGAPAKAPVIPAAKTATASTTEGWTADDDWGSWTDPAAKAQASTSRPVAGLDRQGYDVYAKKSAIRRPRPGELFHPPGLPPDLLNKTLKPSTTVDPKTGELFAKQPTPILITPRKPTDESTTRETPTTPTPRGPPTTFRPPQSDATKPNTPKATDKTQPPNPNDSTTTTNRPESHSNQRERSDEAEVAHDSESQAPSTYTEEEISRWQQEHNAECYNKYKVSEDLEQAPRTPPKTPTPRRYRKATAKPSSTQDATPITTPMPVTTPTPDATPKASPPPVMTPPPQPTVFLPQRSKARGYAPQYAGSTGKAPAGVWKSGPSEAETAPTETAESDKATRPTLETVPDAARRKERQKLKTRRFLHSGFPKPPPREHEAKKPAEDERDDVAVPPIEEVPPEGPPRQKKRGKARRKQEERAEDSTDGNEEDVTHVNARRTDNPKKSDKSRTITYSEVRAQIRRVITPETTPAGTPRTKEDRTPRNTPMDRKHGKEFSSDTESDGPTGSTTARDTTTPQDVPTTRVMPTVSGTATAEHETPTNSGARGSMERPTARSVTAAFNRRYNRSANVILYGMRTDMAREMPRDAIDEDPSPNPTIIREEIRLLRQRYVADDFPFDSLIELITFQRDPRETIHEAIARSERYQIEVERHSTGVEMTRLMSAGEMFGILDIPIEAWSMLFQPFDNPWVDEEQTAIICAAIQERIAEEATAWDPRPAASRPPPGLYPRTFIPPERTTEQRNQDLNIPYLNPHEFTQRALTQHEFNRRELGGAPTVEEPRQRSTLINRVLPDLEHNEGVVPNPDTTDANRIRYNVWGHPLEPTPTSATRTTTTVRIPTEQLVRDHPDSTPQTVESSPRLTEDDAHDRHAAEQEVETRHLTAESSSSNSTDEDTQNQCRACDEFQEAFHRNCPEHERTDHDDLPAARPDDELDADGVSDSRCERCHQDSTLTACAICSKMICNSCSCKKGRQCTITTHCRDCCLWQNPEDENDPVSPHRDNAAAAGEDDSAKREQDVAAVAADEAKRQRLSAENNAAAAATDDIAPPEDGNNQVPSPRDNTTVTEQRTTPQQSNLHNTRNDTTEGGYTRPRGESTRDRIQSRARAANTPRAITPPARPIAQVQPMRTLWRCLIGFWYYANLTRGHILEQTVQNNDHDATQDVTTTTEKDFCEINQSNSTANTWSNNDSVTSRTLTTIPGFACEPCDIGQFLSLLARTAEAVVDVQCSDKKTPSNSDQPSDEPLASDETRNNPGGFAAETGMTTFPNTASNCRFRRNRTECHQHPRCWWIQPVNAPPYCTRLDQNQDDVSSNESHKTHTDRCQDVMTRRTCQPMLHCIWLQSPTNAAEGRCIDRPRRPPSDNDNLQSTVRTTRCRFRPPGLPHGKRIGHGSPLKTQRPILMTTRCRFRPPGLLSEYGSPFKTQRSILMTTRCWFRPPGLLSETDLTVITVSVDHSRSSATRNSDGKGLQNAKHDACQEAENRNQDKDDAPNNEDEK